MLMKTKIHKHREYIALIVLTGGNLLFFLTIWLLNKYDKVSIDQFIYQLKTSAAGANRSLAGSAVVRVGLFGVLATAAEVFVYLLCSGRFTRFWKSNHRYVSFCKTKLSRFITKRALPLALAVLLVSAAFFTVSLDVVGYVGAITTESTFIKDNYVDPNKTNLTFPETKRNLIYIFLESMEVTFSDPTAGGPITENFIPELTELADQNVSFSHREGLGGAYPYVGTTWTAAAMVTQTSGVIVQVPLTAENYGGENAYIPGLVSIGEILKANGYQQTLLLGSDAAFAGRDSYFSEHGEYNIVDINSLKAEGRLPEDYREWWGYEDEKLFAFAKEELIKLSQSGEPFNFTMLTADSHFPDGYVCRLCGAEYDEQYPNVLRCSSRQVAEFVKWIQQQPFYENTTIVLSADHLTMDANFLEDAEEDYIRTTYNCFINAPIQPVNEKNREFGTFDMFPTTLAAMGVTIEGDRLGLGTNLFSDKETLTERYSYEFLNTELQKKSTFYNEEFLHMGKKS